MSDTIDRRQAIDAIRNADFHFTIKSDINFADYRETVQEIFNKVLDAQQQALEQLPSAQTEIIMCKDCKHWYSDADTGMACEFTNMGQPEDGFCNWADMRGENDGTG